MPELFKRDDAIWARSAGREVQLERSHDDRKKAAYWRAVDASGKPLTAYVMNPNRAAIVALK